MFAQLLIQAQLQINSQINPRLSFALMVWRALLSPVSLTYVFFLVFKRTSIILPRLDVHIFILLFCVVMRNNNLLKCTHNLSLRVLIKLDLITNPCKSAG